MYYSENLPIVVCFVFIFAGLFCFFWRLRKIQNEMGYNSAEISSNEELLKTYKKKASKKRGLEYFFYILAIMSLILLTIINEYPT